VVARAAHGRSPQAGVEGSIGTGLHGRLPRAGWLRMLEDSGFADVVVGEAVDTFGGAKGEDQARAFEVYGYAFLACRR
jgi:hypothetical protein